MLSEHEQLACGPPRAATRDLSARAFSLFGLGGLDVGDDSLSFCGRSIDMLSGERKQEEP